MADKKNISLGVVLLSVFLFTIPTLAETDSSKKPSTAEKDEKLEGAMKKAREEEETLNRHQKHEKQVEQIMKVQQAALEDQRRLRETLDRLDFATAEVVLSKRSFEIGEKIDVAFVLTNKSKRSFLIDGRKFPPTYIVKDGIGKTVLTLGEEQKRPLLPEEKDLIRLGRKEKFVPLKVEPFNISKPGKYTLWGEYEFVQPLQEILEVWVGTVRTRVTRFEVVEKKTKNKNP